ncbi:MAG: S8 family serine peptidase [Lewinellaceae bacterium]|nr:S8 family serine peptidase [Lewinellaceae bacterium]
MRNQVIITLTGPDGQVIRDGEVTLTRLASGGRSSGRFDPAIEAYRCEDCPAGLYRLQAGKEGWIHDERQVEIQTASRLRAQIAPAGTPYYLEKDMKIFYQPLAGKTWIKAAGKIPFEEAMGVLTVMGLDPKAVKLADDDGSAESLSGRFIEIEDQKLKQFSDYDAVLTGAFKNQWKDTRLKYLKPMTTGAGMQGLTPEIILKLAPGVPQSFLQSLPEFSRFQVIRPLPHLGNAYLLAHRGPVDYAVLEMVKPWHAYAEVLFASPNLVLPAETFTSGPDYLFPLQEDHLELINAPGAWNFIELVSGAAYKFGSQNITIAVIEPEGIAPDHPDLIELLPLNVAKMVANFDFVTGTDQDPADVTTDHGTQVTSVACAATFNSQGMSGIAGGCGWIGAKTGLNPTTLTLSEVFLWVAGFYENPGIGLTAPARPADIINLSNGYPVSYSAILDEVIHLLTTFGRNGRGCLICCAAGNYGFIPISAGTSPYPALHPRTITVGASIGANPTSPCNSSNPDPAGNQLNLTPLTDTRAYYSPYGFEMDLVAPSHTSYNTAASPLRFDPKMSATPLGEGRRFGVISAATTLGQPAVSGAVTASVISSAGFAVGDWVLVGDFTTPQHEFKRVQSLSGNTLTFTTSLQQGFPSGAPVITGPADYRQNFGGTSQSCPLVAGTAALMLSVRPELNWLQVREILRNSAVKVDLAQAHATGQWSLDGNGNAEFSQWYGYGRLDVLAAVKAAFCFCLKEDLVIRDNLADTGAIPSSGWHANSPDIWVRNAADPIPDETTLPYAVAGPHQQPIAGQDNYLYIRIKNTGTRTADIAWARISIAHFPGIEFRYPQDWMPSNPPGSPGTFPAFGSYPVGEAPIGPIAPGDTQIVRILWPAALIPPQQVDIGGGVMVNWHPCLLAEVAPHDGPLTTSTGFYPVQHDNNIAHKNISIFYPVVVLPPQVIRTAVIAGSGRSLGIAGLIIDRKQLPHNLDIRFRIPDSNRMDDLEVRLQNGKIKGVPHLPPADLYPESGEKILDAWSVTLLESAQIKFKPKEETFPPLILRFTGDTGLDLTEYTPDLRIELVGGTRQLVYSGGAPAIYIPMALKPGQFLPLLFEFASVGNPPKSGVLKVTQVDPAGNIGPGFELVYNPENPET